MSAVRDAASQLTQALDALQNHWDEITERYKFIKVKDGEGNIHTIESAQYKSINLRRRTMIINIQRIMSDLKDQSEPIIIRNTNQTHSEDGNPMFTVTRRGILWWLYRYEESEYIGLRTNYWTIGKERQAYWTIHEFARYSLHMGNNDEYSHHFGIQAFDDAIEWLVDKYNE